jgi:hypothetical protein
MSESKHTPGPWAHRNGRIYQSDREVLTVANVARAADGDFSPANGDLIAAAPELLAALQHIVEYDNDGLGSIGESLARAAIAKATGEQL